MCGISMNHLVDIDFPTCRGRQYDVLCLSCVCECALVKEKWNLMIHMIYKL